MLNKIVDASPTLAAYLAARARGASKAELKVLREADEAARDARPRDDVVMEFKPRSGEHDARAGRDARRKGKI